MRRVWRWRWRTRRAWRWRWRTRRAWRWPWRMRRERDRGGRWGRRARRWDTRLPFQTRSCIASLGFWRHGVAAWKRCALCAGSGGTLFLPPGAPAWCSPPWTSGCRPCCCESRTRGCSCVTIPCSLLHAGHTAGAAPVASWRYGYQKQMDTDCVSTADDKRAWRTCQNICTSQTSPRHGTWFALSHQRVQCSFGQGTRTMSGVLSIMAWVSSPSRSAGTGKKELLALPQRPVDQEIEELVHDEPGVEHQHPAPAPIVIDFVLDIPPEMATWQTQSHHVFHLGLDTYVCVLLRHIEDLHVEVRLFVLDVDADGDNGTMLPAHNIGNHTLFIGANQAFVTVAGLGVMPNTAYVVDDDGVFQAPRVLAIHLSTGQQAILSYPDDIGDLDSFMPPSWLAALPDADLERHCNSQ